jgi:prepilin-type N-terminal cleavage/methylation domain-containing protein
MNRAAGFTLMEMLVAIGLMALMGVICWRGLVFVANQRSAIEVEAVELAQLVRVFAQIEHDLAERLPDIAMPARTKTAELPLAISIATLNNGNPELEILRASAQSQPQLAPLRVVYRLAASGLVRTSAASEVLLLPGAARLRLRVHAGGFWLEPGGAERLRPFAPATALEIAVDDGRGARYVKVLAL